eukprot:COSAG06_NODE_1183_length_10357_cov_17.781244_5_plen_186_part_00
MLSHPLRDRCTERQGPCVRRRRRANPTLTTARTADRCRTTPAHADLGAASAASRDLQGARLGPFRRRNRGGSNEHMSEMAGCVTVRHSLRHTSPRPQPRQRLVTGALERSRNRPPGAPRATQGPWQAPGPACTRWRATPPHQRATCIAVHSYARRGSSLHTESRSAGHVPRLRSAIGRLAAPQYE